MSVLIRLLSNEYEEKYTQFINGNNSSLMYYSLKYRGFLTELLGDNSDYLIAIDENDEVVGCMPVFYRYVQNDLIVANSLPFYGGHGGPLAKDEKIMNLLLVEYVKLISDRKCSAATVIGSPLEDYDQLYKEIIKPDYVDERIELMTYFPYEEQIGYDEALMKKYHYKERNSIRKAVKSGVSVTIDNSDDAFEFLLNVHTDNMLAVGGVPKTRECFDSIRRNFTKGIDYNLYMAQMGEERVAALLLLYFNKTVEYYTPVIVEQYRNIQPLANTIYVAMQDAMNRQLEKWNWGGTSIGQKSLYDFKSKWGTTETRYFYYVKILDSEILKLHREYITDKFSGYYVYPFNQVIH